MAIIRNERAARREPEPPAEPEVEEEIDYSWHPDEDEFASPLAAAQWAELLGDPSFAETDAAKAVRCLHEYGEPATFQQLSIRYRGTMGRYRRWLSEAAQAAAERFGVPAPQQDQFGLDEWWPLLYQTRATGKPGAGIFEMRLRDEVEDAFELMAEQERQAKRAENVRNLKRIEQLERARKEERERKAAEQRAQQDAERADPAESLAEAGQDKPAESPAVVPSPAEPSAPVPAPAAPEAPAPDASAANDLAAVRAFLLLEDEQPASGLRFVAAPADEQATTWDEAAPLDYALRYAERLRHALALMRAGDASITAARVARVAGEPSVERLQAVLNGQAIPSFDLLDRLQAALFVATDYLEAPAGQEGGLPVFASLHEALGTEGVLELLRAGGLREVAYVVDDSAERRTGVIVRTAAGACALLARVVVNGAEKRSESPQLDAFIRMVDELDDLAREQGMARTSRQVGAAVWDELVGGRAWPGRVARG